MFNCIIIDDDKVAQKAIEFLINKTPSFSLIGIYDNPNKALIILESSKIDLIFLDIEMPEMSGIDFLKTTKNLPQIIICSSKKEYAADAFEYVVTDYLVKPISPERFTTAVDKVLQSKDNFKHLQSGSFFIKNKGAFVHIITKDILYFEALSDYVCIYTKDNRYTISSTMKAIELKVLKKEFVRIHRSFIVRLDKITGITNGCVVINEKSIPISKSYKKELLLYLSFL